MRGRNWKWFKSAALVGTVAMIAVGCHSKPSGKQSAGGDSAQPPRARVIAAKPERKTIKRQFTQPGQIDPFEVARLYAKIPGYVQVFHADIGDEVSGPQYDASG